MKTFKTKLKTALTAISLSILAASCGCFPVAPDIRPKQIIQRLNVCKQYKATFGKTLTFKYEKDLTIEECLVDGSFVLTDQELVDLRRTYNAARECVDDEQKKHRKCKVKNGN